MPAPGALRDLAECVWVNWVDQGPRRARILPDGCMDLVEMNGAVLVAGPDSTAFVSHQKSEVATGIRFRPGALPRLLGIPANELCNARVAVEDLHPELRGKPLASVTDRLLGRDSTRETAPWQLAQLRHVTRRFAGGASVADVADEIGWSARNLQRQSAAVYGYGPATLRRVLRFRRAVGLLRAGRSITDTAAIAGYADQSHLYRQVRDLAGVAVAQLANGANRSTDEPSGSTTVA